jgi:hypothetical protein
MKESLFLVAGALLVGAAMFFYRPTKSVPAQPAPAPRFKVLDQQAIGHGYLYVVEGAAGCWLLFDNYNGSAIIDAPLECEAH